MSSRINRHEMFMRIACMVGLRSTCKRAQVGAVITQESRIVSTGYVGSPSGSPHCLDVGCTTITEKGEKSCISTIHAEMNAVGFAARHGVKLEGAILYCTHTPCLACAKVVASSGIKRVYYEAVYKDPTGAFFLREHGIQVTKIDEAA